MNPLAPYEPDLEETLTHLPPRKRREMAFIVKIILEEFEEAQNAEIRKGNLRTGRILKLILFGSYGRGTQVEDRRSGYNSDYDILAVVNNEEASDHDIWWGPEKQLIHEELFTKQIRTPVEIIVHSYQYINRELAVGRPFFLDIMRDGIVLYDDGYHSFDKPGKMSEAQQRKEAKKYFNQWYKSSLSRLKLSKISFNESKGGMDEHMRDAAFDAHQATERIYHCVLLVLTLYSPKLHNLQKLRSLTNAVVPQLIDVWPRHKKFYKRSFELLRRAYVEARYSLEYKITKEELQWLYERIEDLQNRVREICEARLRK